MRLYTHIEELTPENKLQGLYLTTLKLETLSNDFSACTQRMYIMRKMWSAVYLCVCVSASGVGTAEVRLRAGILAPVHPSQQQ